MLYLVSAFLLLPLVGFPSQHMQVQVLNGSCHLGTLDGSKLDQSESTTASAKMIGLRI